jgi:hypothetical protein
MWISCQLRINKLKTIKNYEIRSLIKIINNCSYDWYTASKTTKLLQLSRAFSMTHLNTCAVYFMSVTISLSPQQTEISK